MNGEKAASPILYVYLGALLGIGAYVAWQRLGDVDTRVRTLEFERTLRTQETPAPDARKG